MRPSNAVRTVWNAGAIDTSHLGFRPIQKIATIHASSRFIRGIPTVECGMANRMSTELRPSPQGVHVGIVGASGLVGDIILSILAERQFPVASLRLFASARSAGRYLRWKHTEVLVEDA